jgi:hypothetical protein
MVSKFLRDVAVVVLAAAIFVPWKCAWSIGESGPTFLMISPSVRANGMGEALVATADPALTYFNPAALGIWSLNNLGAAGWSHGEWLPGFNLEDLWVRQIYASVGYSSRRLMPESSYNVSLGLQYRNHFINYGETVLTNESGQIVGSGQSYEQNHALTMGLGFEYGFEIGVGTALGILRSNLGPHQGRGTTYDFGAQVRLPLVQMISTFRGVNLDLGMAPYSIELVPSFGFARLNEGYPLRYADNSSTPPLPTMNRWGTAVEFQFNNRNWPIFSFLWSNAWSHHLVETNWEGGAYQTRSWGFEFTVLDLFIYRTGKYTSNDFQTDRTTEGFSIHSAGLTKIWYEVNLKNRRAEHPIMSYLLTHANIGFDYSSMNSMNFLLNQTSRWEFSLSF